ncbi:Vps51/Vps67-domain-containing protein [Pseudoneurospora amorphoporcata]|uniref:Vacuolar protein sorting-associated protein 51 homolog n=1 Tax=Pseudoneurospora amorphoporcata TaxID=241081 RepID=A0AAN6P0I4_9PEZI|nr:Vps51/Vps67-domain-containing protein [Pseudoneurospora amorphoporcata]
MSTIATPRDTGTPLSRRINSTQALSNSNSTPTSSTRPSLDVPRSASSSPNLSAAPVAAAGKRANRAALREYYNLKKAQAASGTGGTSTPILEVTSTPPSPDPSSTNNGNGFQQSLSSFDSIPASPVLDSPDFSAQPYLSELLQSSTLAELLKTYARILQEIRALDAEKKALVYDNYSKLISATETIRKMRTSMFDSNSSTADKLDPMTSTLDAVLGKVYQLASGIRGELRQRLSEGGESAARRREAEQEQDRDLLEGIDDEEERRRRKDRRDKTRELAREVARVPERLRGLMKEGKKEEAAREWEMPRRLLERWKERGVGGEDVGRLLEEGDAIVKEDDEGSRTST